LIKILPQAKFQGADYSLLMVESDVHVLVKEEKPPEAISAVVPPVVFLW
jgi:hypothetical protein